MCKSSDKYVYTYCGFGIKDQELPDENIKISLLYDILIEIEKINIGKPSFCTRFLRLFKKGKSDV